MKLTNNMCVADLMTRNTTTVVDTNDLLTAISTMATQSLSAIPVVDHQGKICGVISSSDLTSLTYSLQCDVAVLPMVTDCVRKTLMDALAEDNRERTVSQLMTRSPMTATPVTSIQQAARVMVESSIHHLPVVDSNRNVVGIVATMDIVRAVAYGDAEYS